MKSRAELEAIENFVKGAYNNFGNSLRIKTDKPFSLEEGELGYSYRYRTVDSSNGRQLTVYNIVCFPIGIERTDYRIKMHEYGHIYFAHLDGLYEELDTQICNVFQYYRGELIERINSGCGIDFADKLIERVIDDPILNHSLHNIAMDMEVNSKILSKDDVEEMEADITSLFPKVEEEHIQKVLGDPNIQLTDEERKQLEDVLKKIENESKIKLILPCRYHMPGKPDEPFPDGLTYPEYLMMIIENLDQFVKMLVNIQQGGMGDTSEVSDQDVKDMLEQMGNGNSSTGLDELMKQMGMADDSGDQQGQQQGQGQPGQGQPQQGKGQGGQGKPNGQDNPGEVTDLNPEDTSNVGGYKGSNQKQTSSRLGLRDGHKANRFQDHRSEERDSTDKKRELGQISAGGGVGCGNSGGSYGTREVQKTTDPVDEAIDEVIRNFKSRVVKREFVRDVMKNHNRGVVRGVIAPSLDSKITITYDPKIVYLIDISGSMNTRLVDRILNTIASKMRKCGTGRGLKYDIISWNTRLGEHLRDIDPKKGVPRISTGGGTSIARGIKYFRDHYDENAILVVISDFEDYLQEWADITDKMSKYAMYGFNYGCQNYSQKFKYLKVRNFNKSSREYSSW